MVGFTKFQKPGVGMETRLGVRIIPSRETLEKDLAVPYATLETKYSVNRNTIKKWLNYYNLTKTVNPSSRPDESTLLSLSNLTLQEIGDKYGVTRERVRQWFSAMGIKKKRLKANRNQPRPTKKELLEMEHLSVTEIAQKFGVSTALVSKWYGAKNITKRHAYRINPLTIQNVQGKTASNLAHEYNVSINLINRWLKELGLPNRGTEAWRGHKVPTPNAATLASLREAPVAQSAVRFQVSPRVIKRWLRESKGS